MTLHTENKLKNLLEHWPNGAVLSSAHLKKLGISRQLCLSYKKHGWIESIGRGVFVRPKDRISWQGILLALQTQKGKILPIHPGGLTALSLQGHAHYLRSAKETIFFFVPVKRKLPLWVTEYDWGQPIELYYSNFIPHDVGFELLTIQTQQTILVSSIERAILECLYLAPDHLDLVECYQIMEGLVNLRPYVLQQLLSVCRSIKVKRLFLYMAEKTGHAWLKYLDRKTIDLGHGPRSIVKDGVYIKDYDIVIPKELKEI